MPVPKKKRSRTKKAKRRFIWKQVAQKAAQQALALSKVALQRAGETEADG